MSGGLRSTRRQSLRAEVELRVWNEVLGIQRCRAASLRSRSGISNSEIQAQESSLTRCA